MKQKVVIKLSVVDQESRKKVFKIAVSQTGVESANMQWGKDQLEVIGDGVDSVVLTTLLRKKVGYAELVSVAPVVENKDAGGGGKEGKDQIKDGTPSLTQPLIYWPQYNPPQFQLMEAKHPYGYDNPSCTIM